MLPCGFDGSFLCLSHEVFEFGEHLFDRIEIGTVGREEQEPCSGTLDDLPDRVALVAAEVVHDDNVAGVEASEQDLLDIALEALAVDRPVKHARCRDPVASKGSQERHGLPVAMRDVGHQPLPFQAPAPDGGHVGLGPGFVDKDQPRRINPALVFLPPAAASGDVRSFLFAGVVCFF